MEWNDMSGLMKAYFIFVGVMSTVAMATMVIQSMFFITATKVLMNT